MNKRGGIIGIVFVLFVVFIAVLLIYGYIGGQEAKKTGVSCDVTVGSFCYKWHTNIIGQITNGINNALGG